MTTTLNLLIFINGLFLVTSSNRKIDGVWDASEEFKLLGPDADKLLKDLMLSNEHMGPLLMFASSQKPSQSQAPRLPSGPDFQLEEVRLHPSASQNQFNQNNFNNKPKALDAQHQQNDFRPNNFRPPPLSYGFIPRNNQASRNGPPENEHHSMNHQRLQNRNIRYKTLHPPQFNREEQFKRNVQLRAANSDPYPSHNLKDGNVPKNRRVPNLAKQHDIILPINNEARALRNDERRGRKFVIFHAPSFTPTERPSSAPYSNRERHASPLNSQPVQALPDRQQPLIQQDIIHRDQIQHMTPEPMSVFLEGTDEPNIILDLLSLHELNPTNLPMLSQNPRTNQEPIKVQEQRALQQQNTRDDRSQSSQLHHQKTESSEKQYMDLPYLEPEYPFYNSNYEGLQKSITSAGDDSSTLAQTIPNKIDDDGERKKSSRRQEKKTSPPPKTPKVPVSFGFGNDAGSGAVPGNPGADYPVYSEIPFTNFDCRDHKKAGFYADLEAGCQIFHNCDIGMKKHSFICPNGTIFHQELFICDWWYNTQCDDSPSFYNLNEGLYTEPTKDEEKQDEPNTRNRSRP